MQIVIRDAAVESRQVPGKNGPMTFRSQTGLATLSDGQVWKIRVPVGRDAAPLSAGSYVLADESFQLGQYGDLMFNRELVLKRVEASAVGAR